MDTSQHAVRNEKLAAGLPGRGGGKGRDWKDSDVLQWGGSRAEKIP